MILAFLTAFFNSNTLLALMVMLMLDWFSGVGKAYISKTICSSKLGLSFEKAIRYLVVFCTLHTISVVMASFAVIEYPIMIGLILKEAISVIENIKAIEVLRGSQNKVIDKLIDILGMDLDKILDHIKVLQKEPPHND